MSIAALMNPFPARFECIDDFHVDAEGLDGLKPARV
jgi:hypothetical protein